MLQRFRSLRSSRPLQNIILSGLCACLAMVTLLASPTFGQKGGKGGGGGDGGSTGPVYTWTWLDVPSSSFELSDINSHGVVVGGTDNLGLTNSRPFLNKGDGNGGRTTVDLWNYFLSKGYISSFNSTTQTGIEAMAATAINDFGQIAGWIRRKASAIWQYDAFFYSPDVKDSEGTIFSPERFLIIPFATTPSIYVTGINDFGTVAGASHVNNRYVPFIWSEQSGLVVLGTFDPSTDVIARGINSFGEICGNSQSGIAWRYSPESGFSAIYSSLSSASDINDLGQVVGTTRSRPSASRVGFREELNGTIRTIKMPKVLDTMAGVVNSFGDVAGTTWDGTRYRPFFYTDATGGIDLFPVTSGVPAEFYPGASNNNLTITGLNDSAQICGRALLIVDPATGARAYDGFILTLIQTSP